MIKLHSITGRVIIGKVIGLIIGILVLIILNACGVLVVSMLGLGTLILFVLMGVMTALVGIFDRHPLFNFKMPWWFRGFAIGFTFMLMYILLAFNTIEVAMHSPMVTWTGLKSPFWMLIDGTIIGAIMSFIETKLAGEGNNLPLS